MSDEGEPYEPDAYGGGDDNDGGDEYNGDDEYVDGEEGESGPCGWCIAFLIGLILIPTGVTFTWRNEANLVCGSGAYDMAQDETVNLSTCSINSEHFESFVHLTCDVNDSLQTIEPSSNITADDAYMVDFTTEQYSYIKKNEKEKTGRQTCTNKKDSSGNIRETCKDETRSCNCYDQGWSTTPETSSTFLVDTRLCGRCNSTYTGLTAPISIAGSSPDTNLGEFTQYAAYVPLGDGSLRIAGDDVANIRNMPIVTAPTTPTKTYSNDFEVQSDAVACGDFTSTTSCWYSTTKRVNSTSTITYNEIGDLRMKVIAYGSTTLSVLGNQHSLDDTVAIIIPDEFGESNFPPCDSRPLSYSIDGTVSSAAMYTDLQETLRSTTNIVRVLTLLCIILGFICCFSPLQAGVELIPCIGDCLGQIVGCVIAIVGTLLGGALWLITFSLAWIFFRPILGFGLLFLALLMIGGSAYYFKTQRKTKNQNQFHGREDSE